MIEFRLLDEKCVQYSACAEKGWLVFTAQEEGLELGACAFVLEKDKLKIMDIHCESADTVVVEGLIRSVLHYGANRNAYIAQYRLDKYNNIIKSLHFRPSEEGFEGEIPEILQGSCHNF